MIKNRIAFYCLFAGILLSLHGCGHKHDETDEHSTNNEKHIKKEAVTIWTDELELFMEHDVITKDNPSNFLVHLTDLTDSKPILDGNLIFEFTGNNNYTENFSVPAPKRPGIYEITLSLKQSGLVSLELILKSNSSERRIKISELVVYDTLVYEEPEEDSHSGSDISFLKEQQWIIDFKTEFPAYKKLQSSVKATGEIIPKLQNFANVSSNIEGIINFNKNKRFPSLGSHIRKGQILAVVTPSVDANMTIHKVVNEYRIAEEEFNRAKDLFSNKSIPEKRYNEAILNYEEKKKVYESLVLSNNINYSDMNIVSPISGYIEKINVKLGDKVNYGQEMFTIVNPGMLILKVNVPTGEVANSVSVKDASFVIEGFNEEYNISSLGGRKTNSSFVIDAASRTMPLYFEFKNPFNTIRIGMFAQVNLKMNDAKEYLTVPITAILDDNGLKSIYVQKEGETFVKRIVKTGIEDGGYIQITDGILETDRIVSIGAYQVKLASLTAAPLSGHGHNH